MNITHEQLVGMVLALNASVVQIGERLDKHIKQTQIKTEESIYNSLPVSVQAEMIEEEYNAALAEMEEI